MSERAGDELEHAERSWSAARTRIDRAPVGVETDEFIESLLAKLPHDPERLGDGDALSDVAAAVLAALAKAEGAFTRRDALAAAVRVAWLAEDFAAHGDAAAREVATRVADELAARAREWRRDAFLGPEALHALSLAAERNALAHSELQSALLRLGREDQRYLLVRAAKAIGRLECLGLPTGAFARLTEWEDADDPAVQGEAHVQRGVIALFESLRSADLSGLRRGLRQSAAALRRAEASEEGRRDAALLLRLVELLLDVVDDAHGRVEDAHRAAWAERVGRGAASVRAALLDPDTSLWRDYATPLEQALEYRLLRVADGLARVAASVGAADEWTNLDEALGDVAAACALIAARDAAGAGGIADAILAIERVAVAPRVGPLIAESIGRTRLRRVVERYAAANRDDETGRILRRLHAAAGAESEAPVQPGAAEEISADAARRLVELPPQALATVFAVAPSTRDALAAAGYRVELEAVDAARLFPEDYAGLYGDDPSVDAAVRPLLDEAWARLGPRVPRDRWARVRDTLVFLVQVTRDVRDDRPPFALRAEDDGLGQRAGEDDLQAYLWDRLRQAFGRAAYWERPKIAGGRADLGVRFPECEIPIEVKAEYSDVGQDHVRARYLTQTDEYAAVRDGVAALMILDLRAENAIGDVASDDAAAAGRPSATSGRGRGADKRSGARAVRRPARPTSRRSLYSLRESFWMDGLAPDPQVVGARLKAVIVGLVPGNRPKPSSTTVYSRRPSGARA